MFYWHCSGAKCQEITSLVVPLGEGEGVDEERKFIC